MTASSSVSRICPWCNASRAPRRECPHPRGDRLDRLDPVMHEIDLPTAIELARHRFLEQRVVPGLDECEDGRAVLRCGLEQREVAQTGQGQVQVRGIGVAVSVSTSTLNLSAFRRSLCRTPNELLIDDQEAKILERERPGRATMGTDDDIDLAGGEALYQRRGLLGAAKAGQHLDADRVVGETFAKVRPCCSARIVVGTRTATCFPACTALNAARTATSVFPYPTSPTSSRSIGRARSMSA